MGSGSRSRPRCERPGRLGRDVAGVAQRPEILPGAVAVVELLLGGLEGREALPAVSGGPVLQLLPPGHADGPSSQVR